MKDGARPSKQANLEKVHSEIQSWIDRLNSLVDGQQASMRLAGFGCAAIAPLRQFLFSGAASGIFQPRQWAVEALGALGAKDVLLEYLARNDHIPDPVIRQGEDAVQSTAARLVARWKTDDVFQILLSLTDKRMLPGVIFALGEFRQTDALPRLERALEDDVARPASEEAFMKFGEAAADTLVSTVARRNMNGDEEVPSSLQRRRSAAKILAETGLGKPFWPTLHHLLDERDPELVVHASKLAVAAGAEHDKKRAVSALLRILPDAPWYVREDAAGCLEAVFDLSETLIEEEIVRRMALPPHKRAADHALIILVRLLVRLRSHAQGPH
jgi:HEAT repeat protein